MNGVQYAIRVAVLWVAAAAAYSFGMLMYVLVLPDALEEALAGEMEGMALEGFAGYWMTTAVFILLGMAILTLLVDNKATRWANAGVGLFYGLFTALEMFSQLAATGFTAPVLLYLMLAVITLLIAGLSISAARKLAHGPSAGEGEPIESPGKALV